MWDMGIGCGVGRVFAPNAFALKISNKLTDLPIGAGASTPHPNPTSHIHQYLINPEPEMSLLPGVE